MLLRVLWTWLRCLATFGIYAFVWVYREARARGGCDRAGAAAWALGSLCAPIACGVLYALGRAANEALARAGRRTFPAWVAPVLHAGIALLLLLGPLASVWSLAWILMPVPLLVVDLQRRRAAGAPEPAARAPGWRVAEGIGVAAGTSLFVLAASWLDPGAMGLLFEDRASGWVEGPSSAYRLEVRDPLWHRVPPGTTGDDSADLELLTRDRQSYVIVYTHRGDASLDDVVDGRRSLLLEMEDVRDAGEERFFLADFTPASLAHYRVGSTAMVRAEYRVLTADLEDGTVEAVGYTSRPDLHGAALASLVSSLEPIVREAGSDDGKDAHEPLPVASAGEAP